MRVNTSVCSMALACLFLVGCAGAPTSSTSNPYAASVAPLPVDIGNLPQVMLQGGTAAEAKALAMGAARSKGWKIASSEADQLVVERPADANMLPGIPAAPGTMLEVTSFFIAQSGGTNVATKAEVVSPALAGRPGERIDYTNTLRDSLTRSLDSLRDSWASNRNRVVRATPPEAGWADPWAGTPYARATPAPSASAPDAASTSAGEPPAQPPLPAPTPRQTASSSATNPNPPSRPTPRQTASSSATNSPAAPEPRRRGAAPVVDASAILSTQGISTAPITPRENMMALPVNTASAPARGSATWGASAEQYARQRGCQVSASGSQLIESRQDGEIHKVPCEGSDSFLVICQNGTCQGLL